MDTKSVLQEILKWTFEWERDQKQQRLEKNGDKLQEQ